MEKTRYPEPVVGAFIENEEGKFLFIKSPKWKDKYTIPGGHIERGETIREALKREVKEEVGLEIEVKIPLQIQEVIDPRNYHKTDVHFIFHDYLCRALSNEVKVDGKEATSFKWASIGEAKKLELEEYTEKIVDTYIALQNMAKGQM